MFLHQLKHRLTWRVRATSTTIAAVILLASACEVPDPGTSDTLQRGWTHPAVLVAADIAYGSEPRQRLDVYAPAPGVPIHGGTIVWVHGGAWMGGDKEAVLTTGAIALDLTLDGWLVASVDYRLAGPTPQGDGVTFPTPMQDVKRAVRWLKANARKFGIDPTRMVVAGDSAGGHLAALVGLGAGILEPTDLPPALRAQTSEVRAWVTFNPAIDLTPMSRDTRDIAFGLTPTAAVAALLGCGAPGAPACRVGRLQSATPMTYLDASDPPGYVAVGSEDTVTPPGLHGEVLYRAARAVLGDGDVALDLIDSGPQDTRSHQGFSYGVNRTVLALWLRTSTSGADT